MVMHMILLIVAGLACTSHGFRVQPSINKLENSHNHVEHHAAEDAQVEDIAAPPSEDSQKELGITFLRIWQAIDQWVTSNQYIVAFLVAAFKATLSDFVAQILNRENIAWRRSAAFCLYGGIYQGCLQQLLYINCFNAMFGTGQDMRTVVAKVLFDQLVHSPLLAIPLVYLFKAVMFNYSLREGIERYMNDARDLLITCWLLWIPAQCLTFSIVPEQWRISFVALVSFFWICAVSIISSRADKLEDSTADDNTRRCCSCLSKRRKNMNAVPVRSELPEAEGVAEMLQEDKVEDIAPETALGG